MRSKKLRVFILDDQIDTKERNALQDVFHKHDVTVARNLDEAIKNFLGPYDLLLLDHDLGDVGYVLDPDIPNTGYAFVKWLVQLFSGAGPKPDVIVHSWNPEGRKYMIPTLQKAGFQVAEVPYSRKLIESLNLVAKAYDSSV